MSLAMLRTFADQAAIALENTRLFTELQEQLEQQTATSETLRVISQSQRDVQPVFDAIAANARKLCDATVGGVVTFDGELLHSVAPVGYSSEALETIARTYPIRPSRGAATGRAVLDRAICYVRDILEDTEYRLQGIADAAGIRSGLSIPMLRDGVSIGAIQVSGARPAMFSERQIAVLQTFADQAVIAIENVRLFNETKEALETQTATADILKVISESPTDVQPVFDAIAERAKSLCNGIISGVARFDGEWVHFASFRGASPEAGEAMRSAFPMRPGDGSIAARAIRERAPVQIQDVTLDADYGPKVRDAAQRAGFHSVMAVPMLKKGRCWARSRCAAPKPALSPTGK
jgi:two-component system, NtrC family, sensor kinase